MHETALPFRVRALGGEVRVAYGVNTDPTRWGFHLLGLDAELESTRGFPVLQATVSYPAEGYAAYFGWVQLVRYWESDSEEPAVVADVPPQLADAAIP